VEVIEMQELSATTREVLERVFPPERQAEAAEVLMEGCGKNLPGYQNANEQQLERVRFAVLRLSRGNVERLRNAVERARSDWRDVLTESGFETLTAHQEWGREVRFGGGDIPWELAREPAYNVLGLIAFALVVLVGLLLVLFLIYIRVSQ
jgi:hypothetical protein